ncbi:MAG: MXAN_5187 C-terminal domain-containing protein [Myxococcaceae bacterium]
MADQPSGSESGKKFADQEQVLKDCDAIEADLAALRAAYEQYFLGLERKPPSFDHAQMKKRLVTLKSSFIRQTAIKFRVNNLNTKFVSYERLWSRTIQEIEDGTYHRDVFKARLHAKKKAEAEKAATAAAPPAPAPVAAAPRPVSQPPGPAKPVASDANVSDAKLKAIFDAYVKAKKRCNEDTSKLSYDAMAATLKKQVPELLKQHNAKSVDFKVVIKDGKAVLRAVPKE